VWTKDYLVRGFVKRQRQRPWGPEHLHETSDYRDEWLALYRVEGARRALKQAKAEAEAYRAAVFAWDAAATRSAVAEAQRVTARQAEAVAREARAAAQAQFFAEQSAERRRQEAAEREEWLDQTVANARSAVSPRTVWMAWAWGQGQVQKHIAEQCHVTTAVVSGECRRYLTVFAPELLYRSSWGSIDLLYDRQVKLAELLKGKPEPPRPESWRLPPPVVAGLPPELSPPPGPCQWRGLSELARQAARRKLDRWVRAKRVAGYTQAVLGQALGVGPERVRQMEQQAKLREARWNWGMWASRQPKIKGRPLDMGGPRDVWLSFELGDGKD
jgi:hypothetical protein